MTSTPETAARLFADGYRIVSRAYRTASRCPPDAEPGELLRSVGGPLLRGKDAADFFRRCHSKEKQTVSEGVMRELVRLAHEADQRDHDCWNARLVIVHRRGWCAEVDGVLVARGRSKTNARGRALQVLRDFPSTMTADELAPRLGQPHVATPPPSPPAS